MEETVIDDCYHRKSESLSVSKTHGSRILERPNEIGYADDKKLEGKCGHFSIRGYVAETRKRDWKISWPFPFPDDCNKLDEDGYWLPPLHVPEFGWWRCPNCLRKLAKAADSCAGAAVNCFLNEVKDDLSCVCENAMLKTHDGSALEAATVKLKGNELPWCHKQCSTNDEILNVHFNIEIPMPMSKNASEFCHNDNIGLGRSDLVKMKEKHEKAKANQWMSQKVDEAAENDDPLTVVRGSSSESPFMGLYESKQNFSGSSEDLAGSHTHDEHVAGQLYSSNGTLHQKKAQKTRLLTDIIKSEVSGVSKKILIFNKDAEINSIHTAANNYKPQSHASKDLDLHSGFKDTLAVHKSSKKHAIGRKLGRTLRAADKGPSLMSWLKDAAGKGKIPKRYGKGEQVAPAAVYSKSLLDGSAGTSLQLCRGDVGKERTASKVIVSKKQNTINQVEGEQLFLTCQQEPALGNVKTNPGNSKHFHTDVVQSKSAEVLPGLDAHEGPNQRKAILSKKKNRDPRTEGTSTLAHCTKDSLATSNSDSVTDLENQKASHESEQRASTTCEQDNFDDIPMDIVELMAKNQHERYLLNAEGANGKFYGMQETNANMKVSNLMDFTEVCGKEVAGFLLEKNSSVQNPQSGNAGSGMSTASKKVGKPGKQLKRNPSNGCGKYNNNLLGMPQPEGSCASKGFVPSSQYQEKPLRGAVQFPVTASNINSDRWSLTCMEFLEAYLKSRTASQESSGGQTHYDGPLIPSNSMHFHNNISQTTDDLSHKCVVCHCTYSLPKRNLTNDDMEFKCPDCANLQKHKGKAVSEIDNRNIPMYTFGCTELGNKYHLLMGTSDMYTNEAISAMNLLRLMDEGACSSTPVEISMVRKQAISRKKLQFSVNNHPKEYYGVEDGVFRTNISMHPNSFEFFNQNHRQGSSREPFAPVNKNGGIGSSLHDAPPDCHKSREDCFISGLSNDATSSEIHMKRRKKGSLSSTASRRQSSHRFPAQDGILSKAKKRLIAASDSVGQSKSDEMTGSMQNCCMTEKCTTNRNPAEFTIPGPGNAFMIGSEDLKFKDVVPSSNKLCVTTNVDGPKRRRMMKLTAIDGH